jgi:predicted nucleic acid-binding protein
VTLIVDASVAIRWFIAAPRWEAARALKEPGVQFFAPEIVLADLGTLLGRLVRSGELDAEDAKTVMHVAPRAFVRLFPIMLLRDRALALALETDLDLTGCFYLALAEWEDAPLVTDDPARLAAAKRLDRLDVRSLSQQ